MLYILICLFLFTMVWRWESRSAFASQITEKYSNLISVSLKTTVWSCPVMLSANNTLCAKQERTTVKIWWKLVKMQRAYNWVKCSQQIECANDLSVGSHCCAVLLTVYKFTILLLFIASLLINWNILLRATLSGACAWMVFDWQSIT